MENEETSIRSEKSGWMKTYKSLRQLPGLIVAFWAFYNVQVGKNKDFTNVQNKHRDRLDNQEQWRVNFNERLEALESDQKKSAESLESISKKIDSFVDNLKEMFARGLVPNIQPTVLDPTSIAESSLLTHEKIKLNEKVISTLRMNKMLIEQNPGVGSVEVIAKRTNIEKLDTEIKRLESLNLDLAQGNNVAAVG